MLKNLIVLVISLFFMVSCTGPDGKVYLKIYPYNTVTSFSSNNSDGPTTLTELNNQKYNYFSTSPGRYTIQYTTTVNGTTWNNYYDLEAEKSQTLQPGKDRYYYLTLYGSGPTIGYSYNSY